MPYSFARFLPVVPVWRLLQLGNLTTSSEQMLPEDMQTCFQCGNGLLIFLYNQIWEMCSAALWGYLAVRDSIKQLTDLCWFLNVLFLWGQRMRWGQGIDGKYPVDITKHDEVFLLWDKSDSMVKIPLSPSFIITLITKAMWWEGNPYHIPFRFSFICSKVLNVGCKAFI